MASSTQMECSICLTRFSSTNDIVKHIRKNHNENETRKAIANLFYECEKCGNILKRKNRNKHMIKHHSPKAKALTKKQKLNKKIYPDGGKPKSTDISDHYKVVNGGGFGVGKVKR